MPILHLLVGLPRAWSARRQPCGGQQNDQTPKTQANREKFRAAYKNFAQTRKDREFPPDPHEILAR